MAAGIRQRHRNDCNRRGKCDCTWQAEVYDAEAEEKIRKTFPTYAAARSCAMTRSWRSGRAV